MRWIARWSGVLGAISLLEPIWRGIKWLLHWLGDFDFVISRIEDPDWMGPMIHWLIDPPGWVTFPALILGVGLLYIWSGYRRSATNKSSSNTPKGFCEIMEAIWWVAERSSWGHWQRMQRGVTSGSAVLESGILNTAEHMLRTSAQNGELKVYGRVRNTTEYIPIDQHFWRLVAFNIERDDVAIEAVKRLPPNSSRETNKLVEPQLKDVEAQIQPHVYTWLGTARQRIETMTNNLRTKGVTGYEKTQP
jgi:hypothetical protein